MLKLTPAMATPGSATAEASAAQATLRPLAGFGAGAFTSEGAWAGSHASEKAVSPALPRFRGTVVGAAGQECAQAEGRGYGAYTQQISLMARLNPVNEGGVGPHPAREPRPV
jgi:hypothetical protein